MKFLRFVIIFMVMIVFTVLPGHPPSESIKYPLNLIGTGSAAVAMDSAFSSEQTLAKNTGEQFVVAILPFYDIDESGNEEINSEFTALLSKEIKNEFPDIQLIMLENCGTYYEKEKTQAVQPINLEDFSFYEEKENKTTEVQLTEAENRSFFCEKAARAQGKTAGANLVIYGETKSEQGKIVETTYCVIPLSGFDVNPFFLKNPEIIMEFSRRTTCSTIESEPFVLYDYNENSSNENPSNENSSTVLLAINAFNEYKKLEFDSALDSFESFKNYEENYQLLFYIGNCHYFNNELNDSCYYYDKTLELEPQSMEALLNKGNALSLLGLSEMKINSRPSDRSREAIEIYDRIIELNPQSAEAWSNKGCVLNEIEEPEEALQACEKALEIDPYMVTALLNKGNSLLLLERFDESLAVYEKVLKIDPENPWGWCGKSGALIVKGKTKKGLKTCEQGLEINPQNWGLWENKGNALVCFGRYEEAQEAYNKALELNPKFAVVWMNKGIIYAEQGKPEKAIRACDMALSIDPYLWAAWYNKGNNYNRLGKYEEAVEAYDIFIEMDPKLKEAYLYKCNSLCYLGRYEEALETNRKALDIYPEDSSIWYSRGLILAEMGRYEESNAAYKVTCKCILREWLEI